jgi:signal-transduction protein with cAMP-binding, CBS, and nucleotidyltransferase domain
MAKSATQPRNLDDLASFTVSGQAGDFVFREGDKTTDMYVVLDGQVEILRQWGSEPRQIALLEAGDFFGETSLLEEAPREVSARAVTNYRCLKFDYPSFDQIVRETPEIAIRMLRRLSHRLRERLEADVRAAEIAMAPLRNAQAAAAAAPVAPPRPARSPDARPMLVHDSGKEFVLDADEMMVGRIDRATGKRPQIDLTDIDADRMLSRKHAKIVKKDGEVFVSEEPGVRNGTYVNGTRLAPAQVVKLNDGDELRFAVVVTRFQYR